ncbi:MAG TPA: DUF370 domain-containing protein [Acidobacteriota bacterium]
MDTKLFQKFQENPTLRRLVICDAQSEFMDMGVRGLLHLGGGNAIPVARIVCMIYPNSAPIRRLKNEARAHGRLIDATEGKQTRTVIITDSGHVILSSMTLVTLSSRLQG